MCIFFKILIFYVDDICFYFIFQACILLFYFLYTVVCRSLYVFFFYFNNCINLLGII